MLMTSKTARRLRTNAGYQAALRALCPTRCVFCRARASRHDAIGYHWCADCQQRGQLLEWAIAHECPALLALPYAVASGPYCWTVAVLCGSDEMIWTLIQAVEVLHGAQVA